VCDIWCSHSGISKIQASEIWNLVVWWTGNNSVIEEPTAFIFRLGMQGFTFQKTVIL
jgi:hypothetical protein